jgi:hypothetical protein
MSRKVVFVLNGGKNRQVMVPECYLKLLICIHKNALCYKIIINLVCGFFGWKYSAMAWR